MKSTQAYQRTLAYERVPKERAAAVFGKSKDEITPDEVKAFEDFMFWHIVALSAKHELPFQIHTGQVRIQGSNPMLLVDLIQANPNTKFILFHGGFPWVGETAVIGMKCRNVWIDSVWLPTLSYTMAKGHIKNGSRICPRTASCGVPTRCRPRESMGPRSSRDNAWPRLAEKVERGELHEVHAAFIGRQIMRDNARALFPKLKRQLWRTDSATPNAVNKAN